MKTLRGQTLKGGMHGNSIDGQLLMISSGRAQDHRPGDVAEEWGVLCKELMGGLSGWVGYQIDPYLGKRAALEQSWRPLCDTSQFAA